MIKSEYIPLLIMEGGLVAASLGSVYISNVWRYKAFCRYVRIHHAYKLLAVAMLIGISLLSSCALVVATLLDGLNLPPYVEGDFFLLTLSDHLFGIVMGSIVIIPLLIWLMVELLGSLLFGREFGGGGLS